MPASPQSLRNQLKLRQLALIAELDASGSLRKAAERLGMSQPAATRLIQELEELMGASLFERTRRGMAPTDMGRLLIRHASMVLAGIDHVHREARALRSGDAGRLRVGMFPGAPPRLLAAAVARLKRETPRMDVQLVDGRNETLLPALGEGTLGMVVGRAPEETGGVFQFELLFSETFSVACAPGSKLVRKPPRDLSALVDHPWVLPLPGSALRTSLDLLFLSQCGRLPPDLVEASPMPATVPLIQAGDLLAVVPRWLAREAVQRGELRVLIDRLPDLTGPIGMITRADAEPSSQLRRMAEALRAAAASFAAGDPKTGSRQPKH